MLNQPEYLDLIVRYLNNPQDEKLHAEIISFCAESKSNESYFKDIERVWKLSSKSARLDHLKEEEAVASFQKALKRISGRPASFAKWMSAVAATILLAATCYWWFDKRNDVELLSLKTDSNIDSVKLADGSTVILAENTIVSYPKVFSGASREIFLRKGRAFFNVTKDPQHPFSITMGESKVSVLGTSFNIDYSPGKIDLDVKTGKVIFSPYSNGASSILTAGQALTYSIQKREFTTRLSQNADSWLTHELIFVDTPLGEVCKQLSHYYHKNIKLEANHQVIEKFNAKFQNNSLDEILDVLKATYNVKIKETKDHITLTTF